MSSQRKHGDELASLRSFSGPEDGMDPRDWDRTHTPPRPGRKLLQLCRQVSRTLMEVLAGFGDDILRDLDVISVTPAAGPGRLLVTLCPSPHARVRDRDAIEQHLHPARGLLRQEVARAVNRRKAPELIYRLIDSSGE